ncbi:MAG: hypothetical protein IT581_20410 [Verrucomicrobiales bacterium]|nr:hypothetical protein [Verrucomicrobiales bacterium]
MTDLIDKKDAGHELWEGMRRMIACEFPEFSASQISLLNLVYWHRRALITLMRLGQRARDNPSQAARSQVERTTQRAEAAFVVLREVARRMILNDDLNAAKRAAVTRQFLEIPLDELDLDQGRPQSTADETASSS